MKNPKLISIILSIFGICATGGLIYSVIELSYRDEVIDKLETEIDDNKDEIKKLKSDISELEYNLGIYKDLYGSITSNNSTAEETSKEEENLEEVVEENTETTEYSNIKHITVSQLEKMISRKEDFVLLLSSNYCSHCINFRPIYNEALSESNIIGYELVIEDMSSADQSIFNELITYTGTPTTIFYKDGVELDKSTRLVGYKSKDVVLNSLKQHSYTK